MADQLGGINAFIVRTLAAAPDGLSVARINAQLLDCMGLDLHTLRAGHRSSSRLQYLMALGWVQHAPRVLGRHWMHWQLTAAARQALAAAGESAPLPTRPQGATSSKPRAAAPRTSTGPVVPPPQFDRMHAPVLRQPAWQPARAGALDHLRCLSRGIDSGHPARLDQPTGDPR